MTTQAFAMSMLWTALFSLFTSSGAIFPKMNAEQAFPGKPFDHGNSNETELIISDTFTAVGSCSHDVPFEFLVSGGSGSGAIVVPIARFVLANLSFITESETGTIDILEEPELNPFGMGSIDHEAFPFEYRDVNDNGATVRLSCLQANPAEVVVIVRDDSDVVVQAHDMFHESGRQLVQLIGGVESEDVLKGRTHGDFQTKVVRFEQATQRAIHINHDQEGVIALVHVNVRSGGGKQIQRTLVTRTRNLPEKAGLFTLHKTNIDTNGDVVLKFNRCGALPNQPLKVHVRLGIKVDDDDDDVSKAQVKECVDVSAIVEDNTLVVHNEWMRRCIKENHLTGQVDGWDVVVMNATMTDPENGYRVRGRLANMVETGIRTHRPGKRRKLAAHPSTDEITTEMLQGRTPRELAHDRKNLRSLTASTKQIFKKVLVHGYCSKNVFPLSNFTNYTVYSDPADPTAFSHDVFARKLYNFTKNLTGCGCIALSQGGAVCLHLLAHYHSCLDYSFNALARGRKIQTVGTPYQGTNLAGKPAVLAAVFGIGCGNLSDITESGAATWLKGIPLRYRPQVHFYTTCYKLKPKNSSEYCSRATHLFLSNPNDGVTEVSRGYLPGGINMGNTEGWCHAFRMNLPPQFFDSKRNAIMNSHSVVK